MEVTKGYANFVLDKARAFLLKKYDFLDEKHFWLDKDKSIGDGGTYIDDYGCLKRVYVGTSQLQGDVDENVPAEAMMIPLAGLFHEVCGHCNQFYGQFFKGGDLARVLAYSHYACECSYAYYNVNDFDKYRQHPHEIAAQYSGVKACYEFCSAVYGEVKANDLMCCYLNFRVKNDSEFVVTDKKYVFVNEFLDDISNQFEQSLHRRRSFPLTGVLCMDVLQDYVNADMNRVSNLQKIHRCKDGFLQDQMLTAIYLQVEDKNGWLEDNLEVFRQNHLSFDGLFKFSVFRKKEKLCDMSFNDLVDLGKSEISIDKDFNICG